MNLNLLKHILFVFLLVISGCTKDQKPACESNGNSNDICSVQYIIDGKNEKIEFYTYQNNKVHLIEQEDKKGNITVTLIEYENGKISKKNTSDFKGKKVLVTMGPTQEALDPVRFISNHSSGKMGLAIAKAFQKQGAEVFVVSGPVSLNLNSEGFHLYSIHSADEMYEAAKSIHDQMDICVFAAAVADYAPAVVASEKIKKQGEELSILLKKNVDIAYELGKSKRQDQIHVGFALETEREEVHAKAKLEKKNFDLVVLNSAKEEGAGFQHDTNKVKIFHKDGKAVQSDLLPKSKIAELILDEVKNLPVWI